MNKRNILVFAALASFSIAVAPSQAQNVILDFFVGDAYQSDQSTLLEVGKVGAFVVDKNGDGFLGADASASLIGSNFSVGSVFGGLDDEIVGIVDTTDPFGGASFFQSMFDIPIASTAGFNTIDAGDAVGFFFFQDLDSSSTVMVGDHFNFFRSDSVLGASGSDIAWFLPGAGSRVDLRADNFQHPAFNPTPDLSIAELSTTMMVAAVPETSVVVALLGALIPILGRRRIQSFFARRR